MEGSSNGLSKGAWSTEEDSLLKQCIDKYGEGKWHQVPLRAGLNRCRKSCRLRWLNYLKPSIKRGKFSCDEVDLLLRLHKLLGNRWSLIFGRLPGRTANDVKNYWNIHLAKREITFPANIPAQELNVLKPQPPSFSRNNGPQEVGLGEVTNKEDSITFNKDEEKCEFLNNQMDGENMLPDNMLEESQEADAVGLVATTSDEAYSSLIDSMSMTFDVEQLWGMFNADNGQFTDGNPDYSHLQSLCENNGKGDSKN